MRANFYVQDRPGEAWHVETEENPEIMLCGRVIPVDTGKVSDTPGARQCPDCWLILERRRKR